jgi:hypothetical protein
MRWEALGTDDYQFRSYDRAWTGGVSFWGGDLI